MQKFTRVITREVELGGERLALSFDEAGVSVRPVGSRKPPHTCSWASILCHMARQGETSAEPTAEEVAAAAANLRSGKAAPRSSRKSADEQEGDSQDAEPPGAGAGGGTLAEVLARLEAWLAGNRPRFLRNLRAGASPAELDTLAQAADVTLPDDLRTLLRWHNGQGKDFAGALEGSWMLLSTDQIQAAKKDLDAAAKADATGWRLKWLPFLDDDAGNYVCADTSQSGGPVHEYWQGNKDHPVVAPSIRAWFEAFVAAAERGEYVEDPERGRFLRRPKTGSV